MATVHEAIIKVASEIPAIRKDKKNQQQGFNYRGVDDVYNALSPLLSRHGLVMIPQVIECHRDERTTAKGTVLTFVTAKVRYRFVASDGSSLEENLCPVVVGEGMDSGDKATNKALSIAHKYALFQMFCIPTEDIVDPDTDSHGDIRPKQKTNEGGKKQPPPLKEDPYNLEKISERMGSMQTVPDLTGYLRSLAVPNGHSQRPAIASLYQTRKAQLEFMPDSTAPPTGPKPITDPQRKAIQAHYAGWDRDKRLANLSDFLRRPLASVNDMTCAEATEFIDAINSEKESAHA